MTKCKVFSEKTHETKRCAKCGNIFGCGVNGKCWCSEVSLDDATLTAIEEKYQGCLCPDCLNSISNLSS